MLVRGWTRARRGSAARLHGLSPAESAQTPAVAGLQSGEVHLRPWGGEVVAPGGGELQEPGGEYRANHVGAEVVGPGSTAPVAKESGPGGVATVGERFTEDVQVLLSGLLDHRFGTGVGSLIPGLRVWLKS